jgi:hypothetical protein
VVEVVVLVIINNHQDRVDLVVEQVLGTIVRTIQQQFLIKEHFLVLLNMEIVEETQPMEILEVEVVVEQVEMDKLILELQMTQ